MPSCQEAEVAEGLTDAEGLETVVEEKELETPELPSEASEEMDVSESPTLPPLVGGSLSAPKVEKEIEQLPLSPVSGSQGSLFRDLRV